MHELIELVEQWAEDRNLIKGSSPTKQMFKLKEEIDELEDAVIGERYIDDEGECYNYEDSEPELNDVILELGDVLVVLIILCAQLEISLPQCLDAAYRAIAKVYGK